MDLSTQARTTIALSAILCLGALTPALAEKRPALKECELQLTLPSPTAEYVRNRKPLSIRVVGDPTHGQRLRAAAFLKDAVVVVQDNRGIGVDELFLVDAQSGKVKSFKELTWYGHTRLSANDIQVSGDLAYLSLGRDGVMAMTLSPFGYGPVRRIRARHFAWSLEVVQRDGKELGYIAEGAEGVSVVNLETGEHLGQIKVPGVARRAKVVNEGGRDILYTNVSQGLARTDLSTGQTRTINLGGPDEFRVLDFTVDPASHRAIVLSRRRILESNSRAAVYMNRVTRVDLGTGVTHDLGSWIGDHARSPLGLVQGAPGFFGIYEDRIVGKAP